MFQVLNIPLIQIITDFSKVAVPRTNDWSVVILCAILLVFALVIVPCRRKLSLVARSLFSQRYFSLLFRECKILEEPVYFFTVLGDMLVFAFGLLILMEHYKAAFVARISYLGAFGLALAFIAAIYWLKILVHVIYTSLFDHAKERIAIISYKFMFLTDAAVVLFPFLIMVQFTGLFALLYGYIPVFIGLFVMLLYKSLKINPGKVNLFQFFIYFCTLEILPYILLVKISSMI